MKKNGLKKWLSLRRKLGKRLFPVRLTVCFLLLGVVQIHAAVNVQHEMVSFKETEVTLKQVFQSITKQLKYDIFYSDDDLNVSRMVRLSDRQLTVGNVLNEVLQGNYSYEFVGKTILIHPSEKMQQQFKIVKIHGVVKDSKGGLLPGVTVLIKGSSVGGASDVNGEFNLELADSGKPVILVFSFVGMQTQEVLFKGEKEFVVSLKEIAAEMEEVVVTGYQQIEKRQLTSAVATVKTEDLNTIGAASIEDMLQGELAGVSVVNTSAAPGAAPRIRVRGTATIAGNAEPLWVLDGVILENAVPVSAEELNNPDLMETFNTVIGGISPSDIESITVLKDASATAIYGTRAANGVIVVTTKKGRKNSFSVNYQHTSAVSLRPSYNDFDLLNSQERVELTQQMYDEGLSISGSVGMEHLMNQYARGNISRKEYEVEVQRLETRNMDWFELLYRNAYTQTHNLSVSGGSDKMDFYVSLSYNGENGMDRVSNYKSYGGLSKVNAELFKGVRLGFTIQAGRRDRESYNGFNPFSYAVSTSRTLPAYDDEGHFFYYNHGAYKFNILNEIETTGFETVQTDLKGIINLTVDLYKGLRYVGLYSYTSSNSSSVKYAKEQSNQVAAIRGYNYGGGTEEQIASTIIPFGGVYDETNYDSRMSLIRNSLEYKTLLTEELSLDVMVGQEFRTTNYKGLTSQTYGYMHDRGNIFYNPSNTSDFGHIGRNSVTRTLPNRSNISYYGVLSAMLKNRYVINGNIRFDGSNLFGSNPKYRYLPLWSVSGKWILSNENFMQNVSCVNNLAVRASYGLRGNIVEDSSPQIIATALPPNSITQLLEMSIIQAPNPELKWETTSSLNIGAEMSLFENRLNATLDYYRDYSHDLIAMKDISGVSGFLTKNVNYADVKNHGIELALSGYIFRQKKFSWRSSLTLGYVKNKVTKSNIVAQAQNLVKSTYVPGEVVLGKPVSGMFSYRFAELNNEGDPLFYDSADNKLGASDAEIATAIYSNVDNLKYEGPRDPIVTGGFNNVLKYKDFTLSFLFSFGFKNKVRLPQMAYQTAPGASENANRRIMERWRKPGDEATRIIPRLSGGASSFQIESGYFYTTDLFNQSQVTVIPGDYFRMRNLMLEYRLPARIVNKVVMGGRTLGSLSLKFQVQNVFVLADKRLKGYDPETINYTSSSYGSLPLARTFTVGLNFNF